MLRNFFFICLATGFLSSGFSLADEPTREHSPSCVRGLSLNKVQKQLEADLEHLADWMVHPDVNQRSSVICMYLGGIRGRIEALEAMSGDIQSVPEVYYGYSQDRQSWEYQQHLRDRTFAFHYNELNNPFEARFGDTREFSRDVVDSVLIRHTLEERDHYRQAFQDRTWRIQVSALGLRTAFLTTVYAMNTEITDNIYGPIAQYCGAGIHFSSLHPNEESLRRVFKDRISGLNYVYLDNAQLARRTFDLSYYGSLGTIGGAESLGHSTYSLFTLNNILKALIQIGMELPGSCGSVHM